MPDALALRLKIISYGLHWDVWLLWQYQNIQKENGCKVLTMFWAPLQSFRGWSPLRKILGSKEHLDWLKTDLNATEIITV